MDISSRTALLLEINKEAAGALTSAEALSITPVKNISKSIFDETPSGNIPLDRLSEEERFRLVQQMAGNLRGETGEVTYSPEQRAKLEKYQELFDNWDSYKEYVNGPLQAMGDDIMKKVVRPLAVKMGLIETELKQSGEYRQPTEQDKIRAVEELKRAEGSVYNIQSLKIAYSSSVNKELLKIASPKKVMKEVSSAFDLELSKSLDLVLIKSASSEFGKINMEEHDELFELALAHHILTQEGLHKEAQTIDNFVKQADVLAGMSSAWESTKSIVNKGVEYLGRGLTVIKDTAVRGAKWIGRVALRGIKYLVKYLPVVGIIFSVPFMIKNLIEAFHNGKRILSELPLSKYGFSVAKSIMPRPGSFDHVRETFKTAVDNHKTEPENLIELITIFRTIGAFWIDTLLAITNGFMAILDLIIILGLILGPLGWLSSVGAMGASWLLMGGILGLELGAEYFKESAWNEDAQYLLDKAKEEVQKIIDSGTKVVAETGFAAA